MEAVELAQLIRARVPELQGDEIDRIQVALSGEEVVPLATVSVILAVVEKLEARLIALEEARAYRLM